ncbi:MAG TPA: DUF4185 domain-containing protein [Candidatus Acidoferrum sp.]|nr:DUF4185 domain-containing protein [Candidatus Acidoferrum sp.]
MPENGKLVGLLAVAALLFSLTLSLQVASPTSPAAIKFKATSWPEGDQLFRKNPLWLGGDVAYSIDLGIGRVLWLFGDSFIAHKPGNTRIESKMVHNNIAIENGYNPSQASIKFYWPVLNKQPTEFVSDAGEAWLWPEDGVRLGDKLLLFFVRVRPNNRKDSLGFELFGWAAFLVENPDKEPSTWVVHRLDSPQNSWRVIVGTSLFRRGDFLYAFGSQEPSHDDYLLRWPLSVAMKGDLTSPEWWCGASQGWVRQDKLTRTPPPVIPNGSNEFSVQWDQLHSKFLNVESEGFGASDIAIRWADLLEGPWSQPVKVYHPPESNRPDAFVYAGKGHPELQGADVIITYAANSMKDRILAEDMTIYYPHFIRLNFESK